MNDSAGQTVDAAPFEHRFTPLREVIEPDSLGIEIGPFLNPLATSLRAFLGPVANRL